MRRVAASYFDGRSTRRQQVELEFTDSEVIARGEWGETRAPRSHVEVSEAMGKAPRFISFPDGKRFEVADLQTLADCLLVSQLNDSPVVRLQSRWSSTLGALVGVLAFVAAAYVWGLPALGSFLAPRVPASVVASLSASTLQTLDEQLLKPSELPQARQEALKAEFDRILKQRAGQPAYRIYFRQAPGGPNAFALPGGEVVIFDSLVKLAKTDDEIVGVVAHELGHVARHHGMRQLIQSSIVSFIVGVYLGDVSSIATGLGTLVLQSNYSRSFELEADAYAAQTLRQAGLTAEPLATMLQRLEDAHGAAHQTSSVFDWLSSHPDTAERIRRLRAAG